MGDQPIWVTGGGRSGGKSFAAAPLEVFPQVDPSATKEEAEAFLQAQIKRCAVNLTNAQDRGDTLAAANLERKIAAYQYLQKSLKTACPECGQGMEPVVYVCPNCKVAALEQDGTCACCGYSEENAYD